MKVVSNGSGPSVRAVDPEKTRTAPRVTKGHVYSTDAQWVLSGSRNLSNASW